MLAPEDTNRPPVAVLGAGDLVSHLRRIDAPARGEEAAYTFNVFRENLHGQVIR